MDTRSSIPIVTMLAVVLIFFGLALWQPVVSQSIEPPVFPALPLPEPQDGQRRLLSVASDVEPSQVSTPAVNVGQPGLSYRHVQTFGVTEQAYISDTVHLNYPWGIGTDGTNVWIAESRGRRAVQYTRTGTFLKELGKAGFEQYQNQVIWNPADIAVDADGNLWLVDGGPAHVLKFGADGNFVSELGQVWQTGTENNRFSLPASIAFDSAGNVYVSDGALEWSSDVGNHRIQVFNQSGAYLTTLGLAGVLGSDNSHFHGPRHIAIYENILYVADSGNHRVQLFDVSAALSPVYVATLGVSGQFGNDNNHFSNPSGVAVNADFIYVADTWNNRVQVFNRVTRTYAATIGGSYGTGNNQFKDPGDVAVDSAGALYVTDYNNRRVQQFDSNRQYVRTFGATGVPYLTDGSHYNLPIGMAIARDGSIYLVEENGHRLIKLDQTGTPIWTAGEAGVFGGWDEGDNSHLNSPSDVAVDQNDRVYVADRYNSRIQIFNSDGSHATTFGSGGTGNDQFVWLDGLTIAPNGDLYVADTGNQRVHIFDANRNYMATLGITGQTGSDNAHFNQPKDVAVDSRGVIYVADQANNRVQVFDAQRTYIRTMGETGVQSNGFAHLGGPHRLFVDAQDRLYVADTWNNRIQVFNRDGHYLTTIGGSWGSNGGQLRTPRGIAVDGRGRLYVADFSNHRIQVFSPGVPGWYQSNINGFGHPQNGMASLAAFDGQLYAGIHNRSTGAQLWRKDATWTPVVTDGFGNVRNFRVNHMIAFRGHLYTGVSNQDSLTGQTNGGQIWRSRNGGDWEQVVEDGFANPANGAIFHLAVFSDTLYAGTWSYTNTVGAEIWRSATGDTGGWQRVVANGLDDVDNGSVMTMEVYSRALYAGVYNVNDKAEVWRTQDGVTWTRVADSGFGDDRNTGVWTLEPFGDYLYAGALNAEKGGGLWRCQTCDGTDWEPIAGVNGFGDPENWIIESLIAFEEHLYASTYNEVTGMEVWHSPDGIQWTQVNLDGFGDSNTTTPAYDHSVIVFDDDLYIGAWNNANGGEIWKFLDRNVFFPAIADDK